MVPPTTSLRTFDWFHFSKHLKWTNAQVPEHLQGVHRNSPSSVPYPSIQYLHSKVSPSCVDNGPTTMRLLFSQNRDFISPPLVAELIEETRYSTRPNLMICPGTISLRTYPVCSPCSRCSCSLKNARSSKALPLCLQADARLWFHLQHEDYAHR